MEALRERFGKYHVLEKIAQGGMAEVYKVKTVGIAGFEKIQALKRILPHSAREPRFIRSFVDEARIAVELTHRNIVQVFDFGKADGELFLAMELIEGRDLRTAIAQAGARDMTIPIPVAAYVIAEVAAGLDYAHRKTDGYGGALGIVHCDVSPSNVMLSTDGYVKILDFGIARATFASALERRRLRGKPRYMAPEQTLGEPPTAAADVFALGIIAWEIFTGLPLYRGPDLRAILEAVRRTDPPRIDRMNPQVPAEIVNAVATALDREPSRRGAAADLVVACTRTAMQAGARVLADWLAEIDARPAKRALVLSEGVAPPPPALMNRLPSEKPASRESTRSLTGSLANVPVPPNDLGEGTPSLSIDEPPPTEPVQRLSPAELSARDSTVNIPRFGEREPTATAARPAEPTATTPAPRFEPTATTPAPRFDRDPTTPAQQRFGDRDPTGSATSVKWSHEATAAGVGRLADALPAEAVAARAPTERDSRPSRPSYEELVLAPGASPASLRFDDDETMHGFGGSPGEATGFDELEVEADEPPGIAGALGALAEPIDDDMDELQPELLAVRRRSVVVAGVLDGAAPEVLRPLARSLGELAYQRGGVVLELDDDGVVIAFGLEIAGEDDVAIAMGWALDAMAIARDAGGPTLRVGARTGVGTSAAIDQTGEGGARVPGDALDEARALARDAAPDRPMFVGAVGRQTGRLYNTREVAAPRKVVGRRSRVIEVVGPRGFDERDRARLERRGRFIGRTAQLAELEAWLSRAIAADRRLTALISGAAGTGKSRLVAELIARRTEANPAMRVVVTAANPASRHAPFALVIDLYQTALGLPPARGRHARAQLAQRMMHLLQDFGRDRARAIVSDLERAMELRDGGGLAMPEVSDLRPRISAGLTAFRAARMTDHTRPLLTVIEDIHHSDPASLEVLRHALAVGAAAPELLLLTTRPEGPPPPAVDAILQVGDLVGAELRALIADRLGDAATPLNIAAVIARGGGNPLFVEELAQAVREAGDDVPATARDVIAARVDRLSPRAKAALRNAAVLGSVVRARIVEELVAYDAPSRETDERGGLDAELDELVAAGFLVRREASSDSELVFARGLVREVIYDSLSARAQRDSHARIGRLLASRFFAGREEPPAVIADHLERGGETAGGAAFWLRAGRLALGASDAESAIAHFTRSLALERELGVVPPTPTSRARRREALAGREEGRRLLGDLASDPGDLDELQRLCEGEPRRLGDVAIRRAQRMLRIGDFAGATVATVVAEDHAIAAGDRRLHGEALRVRAEVLERLGRFDEALSVVGAARDLFARVGAVAEEMAAMVGAGRIHLMLAHYEAAREAYRPVLARIEKTTDPWLERVVHNHVAVIELCLGNFTAAMASAQRSLELCRRYGDRAREGDALSVAGIILLEVGLFDRAAAAFAEALELLSRTGSRWSRADCLIYAGACDVRRGRASGLAMLDEALGEARRLGARYLEANALITRAGAHLRRGDRAAAIADATTGTEVARESQLAGYEIQGLTRHAVALVRDPRGGKLGEAGGLVHRALGLLEHQRFLEGSEEEVYAYAIEVLRAAGADDRAARVKAAAKEEIARRLASLTDPEWQASYAALPECRTVLD